MECQILKEYGEIYYAIGEYIHINKKVHLVKVLSHLKYKRRESCSALIFLLTKKFLTCEVESSSKKRVVYSLNYINIQRRILYPYYLKYIYTEYKSEYEFFLSILVDGFTHDYVEDTVLQRSDILISNQVENSTKRIKLLSSLYINFDQLDVLLCTQSIYNILNRVYPTCMTSLLNVDINGNEPGLDFLIEKSIIVQYTDSYKLNRSAMLSIAQEKTLGEFLGGHSRRLFNYFIEKTVREEDEMITELLITKEKLKLHLVDLLKYGFLQVVQEAPIKTYRFKLNIQRAKVFFKDIIVREIYTGRLKQEYKNVYFEYYFIFK